jgi:hypothetical protein
LQSTITIGKNLGIIIANIFENIDSLTLVNNIKSSSISYNVFKYGIDGAISNNDQAGLIDFNEITHNFPDGDPLIIANFGGEIKNNVLLHCKTFTIQNNEGFINNNTLNQESSFQIQSNKVTIFNNFLSQGGALLIVDQPTSINSGSISYNNIVQQSLIKLNINSGFIDRNYLDDKSQINIDTNESTFDSNVCNKSVLTILTNKGRLDGNTFRMDTTLNVGVVTSTGNISYNSTEVSIIDFSKLGSQDFAGTFEKNSVINTTLKFELGSQSTGLFSGNILQNTKFTVLNALLGIIENNQFFNTTWLFGNHYNPSSVVDNNYFNGVDFFTNFIHNFTANNFSGASWRVTNNTGFNFNNNKWTSVKFQPLNLSADIQNTNITSGSFSCTNFDIAVYGGIIENGIGTTAYVLDMNDPTVYSSLTSILTIPNCLKDFFGIYTLINCSGKFIQGIINSSTRFPTRFLNGDLGTLVTFRVINGVASSTTDAIVSSDVAGYPIPYPVNNNFGVQDFIEVKRSYGNLNCIEKYENYK